MTYDKGHMNVFLDQDLGCICRCLWSFSQICSYLV